MADPSDHLELETASRSALRQRVEELRRVLNDTEKLALRLRHDLDDITCAREAALRRIDMLEKVLRDIRKETNDARIHWHVRRILKGNS